MNAEDARLIEMVLKEVRENQKRQPGVEYPQLALRVAHRTLVVLLSVATFLIVYLSGLLLR